MERHTGTDGRKKTTTTTPPPKARESDPASDSEIDLERVVYDPEYRRRARDRLNRQVARIRDLLRPRKAR